MGGSRVQIYTNSERLGLMVYLGAVVIPVAVVMNSLMILAFIKYKKLRITGMYFILNLAVSNLIATTVTAPLIIHTIRQDGAVGSVLQQGIACDIRALIDASLLCVSAVSLATSSVDRCLAVCRPFSYYMLVTTRRALLTIAVIWVVCTAVCLPPLFSWGNYKYSRYSYSCAVSIKSSYPMVYFVFVLFIPVLVAVAAYSLIFSVALKSIKHLQNTYRTVEAHHVKRSRKAMKSALRTLALVGVFAITFLPTLVIGCIMWIQVYTNSETIALSIPLSKVLTWVTFSGYALNPIVYGLMDRNFRIAWKTFIKCDSYHNEFRRIAQKQLYDDLEDDKRRELANGMNFKTQSFAMTELHSASQSLSRSPASSNERNSVVPYTRS